MKVEINPLDNFQHGRQSFTCGEPQMVNQADANDLVDAGLAELTGGSAPDDDAGEKMQPVTSNKMMPPNEAKQGKKK